MTDSGGKARQYALKLLSYRGRSEREMSDRLSAKGFSPEIIASTILHLKDAGLLDDLSLAESLKREVAAYRMLSRAGTRAFLLKRGIPKSVVDAAIARDDVSDFEHAVRFVDKKLRVLGKYPVGIAKRRLYSLLSRRGYSPETIMKVLKHTLAKEDNQ